MALVPCPACRRHVRSTEPACPFCRAALGDALPAPPPDLAQPVSRAVLLALSATLTLGACREPSPPAPPAPVTTPTSDEYNPPPPPPRPRPGDHAVPAPRYGAPPRPMPTRPTPARPSPPEDWGNAAPAYGAPAQRVNE